VKQESVRNITNVCAKLVVVVVIVGFSRRRSKLVVAYIMRLLLQLVWSPAAAHCVIYCHVCSTVGWNHKHIVVESWTHQDWKSSSRSTRQEAAVIERH